MGGTCQECGDSHENLTQERKSGARLSSVMDAKLAFTDLPLRPPPPTPFAPTGTCRTRSSDTTRFDVTRQVYGVFLGRVRLLRAGDWAYGTPCITAHFPVMAYFITLAKYLG